MEIGLRVGYLYWYGGVIMKKGFIGIIVLSFSIYISMLYLALFSRHGSTGLSMLTLQYLRFNANFIPFKTIITYFNMLTDGGVNTKIAIRNLAGNLFLFLPFGFYLPFFTKKMKRLSIFIITVAGLIIIIEVMQGITRRGSIDVDDLILNLLGAFIGFMLCKHTPIRSLFKYCAHQAEQA